MHEKRWKKVRRMYLRYLTVCKHIKQEKAKRGKWQTCFHSSYEWSIVGLQMTCGHPTTCVSLLAPSQLTLCTMNVNNTKPWVLEIELSARLTSRHGLGWPATCSVCFIGELVLQSSHFIPMPVKQGHHSHTLKASRLGIICLQSNLGIQKPKLGPLGACKILLGTVWCLSIRFLCSLATLKCSAESWLWPDCRRSLGFDLWHPFTQSGDVWPLISWKLSIVYQHGILSLGALHRYLSTSLWLVAKAMLGRHWVQMSQPRHFCVDRFSSRDRRIGFKKDLQFKQFFDFFCLAPRTMIRWFWFPEF